MGFTPDDIANWMLENRKDTFAYNGYKVCPGFKPFDKLMIEIQHQKMDFDVRNTKFQKLAESVIGECPKSALEWDKLITESSQTYDLRNYLKKQLNENMSNGVIIIMKDGRKLQYSDILDMGTGHIHAAVGKLGQYRLRRSRSKGKGSAKSRWGKWFLGYDKRTARHNADGGWNPRFYFRKYQEVHTIKKDNILSINPVGQGQQNWR